MYQCLNGDILLRKCSIKTSAKWRNSANIPRQWSAIKKVNDLAKKKKKIRIWHICKTWNILGNDTSRFDMLMPTVVRPPIKNRGFKQSPEKQELEKLSEFTDPSQYPYEVGIIRQFTFR